MTGTTTSWPEPVEHRVDGDGVVVRVRLPDHRAAAYRHDPALGWQPAASGGTGWQHGAPPGPGPRPAAWRHPLPARYLPEHGRPAVVVGLPDGTVRGYGLHGRDGGWRELPDEDLAALAGLDPAGEREFVRAVELRRAAEIDAALAVRAIYDPFPAADGDGELVDFLCSQSHRLYEDLLETYTALRIGRPVHVGPVPDTFAWWIAEETGRPWRDPGDRHRGRTPADPPSPGPGPGTDPGHPLAAAYARYLRHRTEPGAAERFGDALAGHGLPVEAALLEAYAQGGPHRAEHPGGPPWGGRRVHVGALPPPLPRPLDLWFDVVEADLSVAVPRSREAVETGASPRSLAGGWSYHQAWVGLAPVPGWRFAAFVAVAGPVPGRVTGSGTDLLAPAVGVTFRQARAYATWFGKALSDDHDSEEAAWTLGAAPVADMRRHVGREWMREHNGAFHAAPFGTTIDELSDTIDDDDGFTGTGHAPDVGFRTSTPVTDGPDTRHPGPPATPDALRYRRPPRCP